MIMSGEQVAEEWAYHNGDSRYIDAARRFGKLGGKIKWIGGVPGVPKEDDPLSFVCILPDGRELSGDSTFGDLSYAVVCAMSQKMDGYKADCKVEGYI
jgi:hypothetical protein